MASGVTVLGINSNQQDSITELAHYASEYKIEFPLIKDVGNVIADQFAAVRTPEIFMLDGDRTVRYFGRVDDQFGFQGNGIAYQRNEARRRDLAVALGTPFISGKDSLNNEFRYVDGQGQSQSISIPPSLLISALGQLDDAAGAVTIVNGSSLVPLHSVPSSFTSVRLS